MTITICGSISSTPKIKEVSDKLLAMGHKTYLPYTSLKIINGEMTMEEYLHEKEKNGDGAFRKIKEDLIKRYYNFIKESDAIIVLNIDKNGIKNYIGGNVFLEMGFAHVLSKKIYLYNNLPDIIYLDELKAMQPIIINGDLSKII
ncbi:MAG: hypothetical protein PHF50_03250 [Patescibacteria group bacterium]|nr:hypothetical protein [Patescibacteria group bacterium]